MKKSRNTPLPWAALVVGLLAVRPASAESFGASMAKGEKAARRGDAASAAAYYTDALTAWAKVDGKTNKAKALSARADAFEREDQLDRALADRSEALRLAPKSDVYLRKRGELYLRMGKASLALTDFYKAVSHNLNDATAYFDRGVAYELQGDLSFAHEDYRTACRLGFKKACHNAKEAKEKLLASRKGAAFEAAEDEKKGPVEIKRVRAKRKYKLDYPACIDAVNACVDAGDGFGQCVRAAKVCEKEKARGCCPQSCLKAFDDVSTEKSEAEAFREVFEPKAACAR